MITAPRWTRTLTVAMGLALVGCNHDPMSADQKTMQRLAAEVEQEVARMRPHLAALRKQTPAQWEQVATEHARMVRQMLERMESIMGEMQRMGGGMMGGMGMSMQDARMGEMMGMSAEEQRDMLHLMGELRNDVEKFSSASNLAEWMPSHLDRLEAMLRMMEASAQHMRSMRGMHQRG
jgi:Ni,Fe-hydrogenase III large subunit